MKTSTIKWMSALTLAFGVAATSFAQTAAQWDFKSKNLDATLGGLPLLYADGSTAAGTAFDSTANFGIPAINGTHTNVMKFPVSGATMGYLMPTFAPNGGSPDLVAEYTIIMDVLYPTNSDGRVRPLVQTDDGIITPDADLVVDSDNGIGTPPGPYYGNIKPNTWYRIGFTVTATEIDEYINGVKVGVSSGDGAEGRFSLTANDYAQLFQNSTTNGAATGYVSSIQIWNVALNAGQMAAIGAPSASKIPTTIPSVPSYVTAQTPAPNKKDVTPLPTLSATIYPGDTVINSGSLSLRLDGSALTTAVVSTASNYVLSAATPVLLQPYSSHTVAVVYSDSVAGLQTNSWNFTVTAYQNISLPAPIYLETFDEVAEGGIPTGWTATNSTDTLTPGFNIFDTESDSYKDWVTISTSHYATVYPDTENYTSPGFPNVSGNRRQMIPPIVENGVLLTNLASGNLIVAESDQRGGSQVQILFTKDYNFAGKTNVYVSFHHINEQNQDNICALEYSVDHGVTWQPLLYMLDDGTTDSNGSDVVTNGFTGEIDVNATFNTARLDQAHGLAFGAFIGATVSTNLIPYIRPCRNDDPVQQKRIELFRLPLADHQSAVRLRFAQAGTGSWFFDIDNLGFYSIPQPVILQQPSPVIVDYNGPATFAVQAGGDNLKYQWKLNNVNITDATNTIYTIANTRTNDIGTYSVGISNSLGGVVSIGVPLTLVYTPVVLIPPQEETITVGGFASFGVTARGGQPLSYQWLFNSNAIPNATNITYEITDAQTNASGKYQVVVSNAFSSVVSPSAKLTVFAGSITQEMVVHLTFDNTYSDVSGHGNDATNHGSPTFEPGFLGEAIHVISSGTPANAPATNNYVTLHYPNDLKFGSEQNGGTATDFSVSFWTRINSQNDDKPFISNKNWDSGSNPGWALATGGGGMKWNYRDNAINQAGVGSIRRDSPTVAPQLKDGGWHHVVVTMARHSVGRIYVDGVMVDESALGADSPTNILGSADTDGIGWNVNIGQDGTGTYTDGGGGAAVDMLMDDVAIWRRVVTDREAYGIFDAGLHSNTVDQATVTVLGAAPTITLQPLDASGGLASTVSFKVSALGTPSLSYQWYFGSTLQTGQTNSSLLVTNIGSGSQGNYSVVITNNYGAVTSRLAVLSFTGVLPPGIALQPVSQYVEAGTPVTFTVAASGTGPFTYQWYKDGLSLGGQNNTNLVLASAGGTNQGAYYAQVTNGGGPTNSAIALLKVFSGTLNNGLVAYLPFDGDYKDFSGRGNNGSPVGTPSFAAGRVGEALHFSVTNDLSVNNYVTLGYPADLAFGTNDFTVGFWVNVKSTDHGDDPAFIGNKDWGSSGNPGWGVFSQGGGNFRVNANGTSGTKQDTKSTPLVCDGNWHFVLCSFWRGQFASIYVDGQFVINSPATFGGSVDTVTKGYAVNIGQDGTGTYTDGNDSSLHLDGLIDEVMLWNRVVTAPEASSLYHAGTNNLSPLILITNVAPSGNSILLNWKGGVPPFTVQIKTNLTDANWTELGTTSNQSTNLTTGGKSGFIRISGASQ